MDFPSKYRSLWRHSPSMRMICIKHRWRRCIRDHSSCMVYSCFACFSWSQWVLHLWIMDESQQALRNKRAHWAAEVKVNQPMWIYGTRLTHIHTCAGGNWIVSVLGRPGISVYTCCCVLPAPWEIFHSPPPRSIEKVSERDTVHANRVYEIKTTRTRAQIVYTSGNTHVFIIYNQLSVICGFTTLTRKWIFRCIFYWLVLHPNMSIDLLIQFATGIYFTGL